MNSSSKEIFDKFYRMIPMKYYDCKGQFDKLDAKQMIENKNDNYIATQKFDGEWCRIIKANGQIVAQSRNISKVTGEYGDKTLLIPHIIDEFNNLPDGTVLIGELCFTDVSTTSKDVGTILRCLPEKAIARQKTNKLIFRVFDCLAYNCMDYSEQVYNYRFNAVLSIVKDFTYIFAPVYRTNDFEDFLQEILANGGEGIVIHSKNYIYAPGKRPAWTTLKVKKITQELELLVIDTIEPKKQYEGIEIDNWKYWIGTYDDGTTVKIDHVPGNIDREAGLVWQAVTKPYWYGWKNGIIVDNNGTAVRVVSGLNDEDREWLTTAAATEAIQNKQLYAAVSAMEIDKVSGSLRHPRLIRLRTDM